jgi:oxygen-independent coproporphyrinogen-3 oxidase
MEKYVNSLHKEIDLVAKNCEDRVSISSIYFGGGSPALAARFLPDIMTNIQRSFDIKGNMGIELHPRDINVKLVRSLRTAGFDMVSIGVQSFQEKCLLALGRDIIDSRKKIRMAAGAGFRVIDVDLIFGIPGQVPEDLIGDFETAVKCGATQISTYPFIEFSYSGISERPVGKDMQKKMMDNLIDKSRERGFKRASVWTFIKKDSGQYSSVTRDNYIGLGPSAASLTKESFKINTFSVTEYIRYLSNEKLPTALTLRFDVRRRALYWLFWSAYNLQLNRRSFRELFDHELDRFFKLEIFLGKKLGFFKENEDGYSVTEKGARLYHLVEQVYTHKYIDKTWRTSIEDPWPEKLVLY